MFDSPATPRLRISLDPWAVDYGSAFGVEESDEETNTRYEVDPFPETRDWSAGVSPAPLPLPDTTVFVDGVQRVDYWARVDDGEHLVEAAFASVAVGAVICRPGAAEVAAQYTSRAFAVAGGVPIQPQVVQARGSQMVYEVQPADDNTHNAVFQAIAVRRRNLERICVQRMLESHPLVIADGRLEGPEASPNQLAGVAKTLHQLYLTGEQRDLIARLRAGERTPLFLINNGWDSRYSWFLRLPNTRRIHHGYAGIVRLEVPATGSRPPADVADMLSYNLPRFASRPEHDARAPQNLLPVGALERRLRHELGDARYVRRLIEDYIAGGEPL